jgi:tRNA A-37 threonylcarbamoyl transferase component Bud32
MLLNAHVLSLSSLSITNSHAHMKQSAAYPPGFVLISRGRTTIAVRDEYRELLLKQGIDTPEKLMGGCVMDSAAHTGRGATPALPIQGRNQENMVIRKYRRGGALRFFMPDIYWGGHRPFKELCVTTEALQHGIPTVAVLAAVTEQVAGPLYRGYLISRELPSSRDLPDVLGTLAMNPTQERFVKKRVILAQVAQAIRSMHDRGFYHGDLNLKNILLATHHENTVYILDWDKSWYKEKLSQAERSRNVLRFCRSMAKLKEKGLPFTERDQLFFLRAYWGDDKSMKNRLRRGFVRMKLSLGVRKMRWKIEKLFDRKQQ